MTTLGLLLVTHGLAIATGQFVMMGHKFQREQDASRDVRFNATLLADHSTVNSRLQCAVSCLSGNASNCVAFIHDQQCQVIRRTGKTGDVTVSKLQTAQLWVKVALETASDHRAVSTTRPVLDYLLLDMEASTTFSGNAVLDTAIFKVGLSALSYNQLSQQHALFGPYPQVCATSPSKCGTGFTMCMWLRKSSSCSSFLSSIFSTRSGANAEGVYASCSGSNLLHAIHLPPSKVARVNAPIEADKWVHVCSVYSKDSQLTAYHDGVSTSASLQAQPESSFVANTVRKLVFGAAYTVSIDASSHSTAYVDDVRIYERLLSSTQLQALRS